MANRFWVGGSGTWDGTTATNWSATTGGAGGATAPTAADDVFLDASSGVGTVTLATGAVCRSLNCTGFTQTLLHTSSVSLNIGDATAGASNIAIKLVAGMTYTLGNGQTSEIKFLSTSATQQTVDFGGKTTAQVTYNGVGGSWILSSAHTSNNTATVFVTNGTLNTNGQTCAWGALSSSNSNTRTITLGASTLTLTNGTPVDFQTATGLTFNANTSTIICTGAANGGFNGGGKTFNNVTLADQTRMTINGANTFNNLSVTSPTVVNNSVSLAANQIVTGTYSQTGAASPASKAFILSDTAGVPRTITAAAVSLTDADFQDITGAGAATWTGTRVGDMQGNTNITFDTARTVFWVGFSGGNWGLTTNWSLTSGGASGAAVPLPQDTVRFDANSITSAARTITVTAIRLGKNIDWTGVLNSPTWLLNQYASADYRIMGSLTMIAAMTLTHSVGSATMSFGGRGSSTITFAGQSIDGGGWQIDAFGGTYTLNDAALSSSAFALTKGTFNANNFNVTCLSFSSTSTNTRTLNMGSGIWTLTGTLTIWSTATSTGLTQNAGTSTIAITNTAIQTKSITPGTLGGAGTFNDVIVTAGGAAAGSVNFGANSMSFRNFTVTAGAAKIQFNASLTFTFTGLFTTNGSAGNVVTIQSSSTTNHILSKASGIVSGDYLSISDSTAQGGAYWAAGNNSIDAGGGNTGWVFGAASFTMTVADSVICLDGNSKSFNGDMENAPTFVAPTTGTGKFIDGTAAGSSTDLGYRWIFNKSGTAQAYFDSTVKRSGSYSLKFSTNGISSYIELFQPRSDTGAIAGYWNKVIPVLPNTKYKYSFYLKTQVNSGSASGAQVTFIESDINGNSAGAQTNSAAISATQDWTRYQGTITTTASTYFMQINPVLYGHTGAATLIMDAWLDELLFVEDRPVFNIGKNPADTVSKADSTSKNVGRNPADTVVDTDAVAKNVGKTLADTVNKTDAAAKTMGTFPADTVNKTDSIAKNVGRVPADTVSVSLSDMIAKAIGKNLADSVHTADSVGAVKQYPFDGPELSVKTDESITVLRIN